MMTGFELGHLGGNFSKGGSLTVQEVVTTYHRTGLRSLYMDHTGGTIKHCYVAWQFENASNTVYVRFGIYLKDAGSSAFLQNQVLGLYTAGGVEILWMTLNYTGHKLRVYTDAGTYWEGDVGLGTNHQYCIEMKVTIADSDGIIQVKIDGVLDIDITGDTRSVAAAGGDIPGRFYAGCPVHGYLDNLYWDDIAINNDAGSINNSWIGQGGILALMPASDVYLGGMEPSTGEDRFACVDEIPSNGDTDYIYNYTDVSCMVALGLSNLIDTALLSVVNAVCWWASARRDGSGDPTVEPVFRIDGANYYPGTGQVLADAYADKSEIFELNPATDLPWTSEEINDMAAGVKTN